MTSYLINFISNIALNNYIGPPKDYNTLPYILGAAIVYVVLTFVLLLLWWKTDSVIKFVAGEINDHEIIIHTSNNELYRVVMRILGISIIVLNVANFLVTLFYNIFYLKLENHLESGFAPSTIERLLINGITILLGVWLIIGNKGINDFKNKISNLIDADNKDKEPPASDVESPPTDDQKG